MTETILAALESAELNWDFADVAAMPARTKQAAPAAEAAKEYDVEQVSG